MGSPTHLLLVEAQVSSLQNWAGKTHLVEYDIMCQGKRKGIQSDNNIQGAFQTLSKRTNSLLFL